MTIRPHLVIFPVLLALAMGACGDSPEARAARKEIDEAIEATKDLAVKTWADLQRKAEPRLQKLDDRFTELREELARRGEEGRTKTADLVEDIEERLAQARAELARAKDAASDTAETAWQSIEQRLEEAGHRLEEAWERLKKD